MTVLVDTSALLAVLDADDANHPTAGEIWKDLLTRGAILLCTNYVLVEAYALIQHRLGMEALSTFHDAVVPLLRVEWVEADAHRAATAALLTARRRRLSLVDCVSFETARRLGITTAFAFDRHFAEQGLRCLLPS